MPKNFWNLPTDTVKNTSFTNSYQSRKMSANLTKQITGESEQDWASRQAKAQTQHTSGFWGELLHGVLGVLNSPLALFEGQVAGAGKGIREIAQGKVGEGTLDLLGKTAMSYVQSQFSNNSKNGFNMAEDVSGQYNSMNKWSNSAKFWSGLGIDIAMTLPLGFLAPEEGVLKTTAETADESVRAIGATTKNVVQKVLSKGLEIAGEDSIIGNKIKLASDFLDTKSKDIENLYNRFSSDMAKKYGKIQKTKEDILNKTIRPITEPLKKKFKYGYGMSNKSNVALSKFQETMKTGETNAQRIAGQAVKESGAIAKRIVEGNATKEDQDLLNILFKNYPKNSIPEDVRGALKKGATSSYNNNLKRRVQTALKELINTNAVNDVERNLYRDKDISDILAGAHKITKSAQKTNEGETGEEAIKDSTSESAKTQHMWIPLHTTQKNNPELLKLNEMMKKFGIGEAVRNSKTKTYEYIIAPREFKRAKKIINSFFSEGRSDKSWRQTFGILGSYNRMSPLNALKRVELEIKQELENESNNYLKSDYEHLLKNTDYTESILERKNTEIAYDFNTKIDTYITKNNLQTILDKYKELIQQGEIEGRDINKTLKNIKDKIKDNAVKETKASKDSIKLAKKSAKTEIKTAKNVKALKNIKKEVKEKILNKTTELTEANISKTIEEAEANITRIAEETEMNVKRLDDLGKVIKNDPSWSRAKIKALSSHSLTAEGRQFARLRSVNDLLKAKILGRDIRDTATMPSYEWADVNPKNESYKRIVSLTQGASDSVFSNGERIGLDTSRLRQFGYINHSLREEARVNVGNFSATRIENYRGALNQKFGDSFKLITRKWQGTMGEIERMFGASEATSKALAKMGFDHNIETIVKRTFGITSEQMKYNYMFKTFLMNGDILAMKPEEVLSKGGRFIAKDAKQYAGKEIIRRDDLYKTRFWKSITDFMDPKEFEDFKNDFEAMNPNGQYYAMSHQLKSVIDTSDEAFKHISKFTQVYKGLLNFWKASKLTIVPGYFLRIFMGNTINSSLALGRHSLKLLKEYPKALKMMSDFRKIEKKYADGIIDDIAKRNIDVDKQVSFYRDSILDRASEEEKQTLNYIYERKDRGLINFGGSTRLTSFEDDFHTVNSFASKLYSQGVSKNPEIINDLLKNKSYVKIKEMLGRGVITSQQAVKMVFDKIQMFSNKMVSGVDDGFKLATYNILKDNPELLDQSIYRGIWDDQKDLPLEDKCALATKISNFDYSQTTDWEKRYIRKIIPFYVFMKKNIAYQTNLLLNKRGWSNVLTDIQNWPNLYDDPSEISKYDLLSGYLPIKIGNKVFTFKIENPTDSNAFTFFNPSMIGRVNPEIQWLYGAFTGNDISTGTSINWGRQFLPSAVSNAINLHLWLSHKKSFNSSIFKVEDPELIARENLSAYLKDEYAKMTLIQKYTLEQEQYYLKALIQNSFHKKNKVKLMTKNIFL